MKQFRVGIIGTGFGAKVHAPMMMYHDGYEVVAISSVSRGNEEEVKKQSGVNNVYTDWKLMLAEEDLDLLVIASSVNLHHQMVLTAFEKGLHVLCEKPMALNKEETNEMISKRDLVGKLGFINHEFRFLPARLKVKEIIDSGKIGDIIHVRYLCTYANYISLLSNSRGWLGQSDKGGGMLGAIGSHMIDSLHWWFNSKFNSVIANLPIHVPYYSDSEGLEEKRTADDSFQVIGTLLNGATITLELISAARQSANSWRLEVFGSEGTLIMEDDKKVMVSYGSDPLQEVELVPDLVPPSGFSPIAARYYNGFNRMLDALYDTLSSGLKHPNLADFENGQNTQIILDAIRYSSKTGVKVNL